MKKAKTFFIADDDVDDQELFIEALRQVDKDCTCLTASNGQEALARLEGDLYILPDFIFLDLNMPLLGGKDCLAAIKKNDTLRHIPVIIYSTSAENKDIEETMKLGAAYFLQKPNRFEDMCSSLKDILQKNWS